MTDPMQALRQCVDVVSFHYDGYLGEQIEDHAEALARQVAEAEARAGRLREAYLDAENDSVTYALPAHNEEHDDNVTPNEWINAIREAHLDPGDLDAHGDPTS